MLGAVMASVLLLTVAVSAAASTQTTILPTARGTLAMAVYGAIPQRFAQVHPRYKTPGFGTMVMGITAIAFYLVLSLISANALADSIASLGLAVAFYYGIVAFSCVWYFRRTLFTSARHFFMRGLLPLLGGIGMAAAFIISARDMLDPEYGFTAFGPIGGVFVIGIGMLALGVPLMIACAVRFRAFFRGETLNEDTPILVPDTGQSQWLSRIGPLCAPRASRFESATLPLAGENAPACSVEIAPGIAGSPCRAAAPVCSPNCGPFRGAASALLALALFPCLGDAASGRLVRLRNAGHRLALCARHPKEHDPLG